MMANMLWLQREAVDTNAIGPPFYFMTAIGEYTDLFATSLLDLLEIIKHVDLRSLVFHLDRRDFQRWIMDRWHLDHLVEDLDLIQRRHFEGERLRQQLITVIAIHVNSDMENDVNVRTDN
jgi:hypothetical protein